MPLPNDSLTPDSPASASLSGAEPLQPGHSPLPSQDGPSPRARWSGHGVPDPANPASSAASTGSIAQRRPLTSADAVDIWLARWLRIPRKHILARYGCDPRRLYEIWQESRFPGSRAKALEQLAARYPWLVDRVDVSLHRRIPRTRHPDQLGLFD